MIHRYQVGIKKSAPTGNVCSIDWSWWDCNRTCVNDRASDNHCTLSRSMSVKHKTHLISYLQLYVNIWGAIACHILSPQYTSFLWNSMTSTSFIFTELANTMRYGRGFLYNLVFTEWRHCVPQNYNYLKLFFHFFLIWQLFKCLS